jgi:hypothetical protein
LTRARLELLEKYKQEKAGEALTLEQIIRAFLEPGFLSENGKPSESSLFIRLRTMVASEDTELFERLTIKYFDEVSQIFLNEIRRALPNISDPSIVWRFQFLLGAQYYALSNSYRVDSLSHGLVSQNNRSLALNELIAFVAAGMRADVP